MMIHLASSLFYLPALAALKLTTTSEITHTRSQKEMHKHGHNSPHLILTLHNYASSLACSTPSPSASAGLSSPPAGATPGCNAWGEPLHNGSGTTDAGTILLQTNHNTVAEMASFDPLLRPQLTPSIQSGIVVAEDVPGAVKYTEKNPGVLQQYETHVHNTTNNKMMIS